MSTVTPNYRSGDTLSPPASYDDEPVYFGIPLTGWVKIGTVAVLFVLLFWPTLRQLWEKTNPFTGEDNWKHAIFVPLLGLYYLYVNRDQLAAAKVEAAWSGLAIMLFGVLLYAYAIWPGQNDWIKDVGMVIALFGVVTFLCGWQIMRTAWFPIAFLICALPWPGLFYSMLAGPLQEYAARFAVYVMKAVGVHAGQAGTKIFVEGKDHLIHTLNVAEACAGLRSLMTFISIAAAVAFLSYRPLWQRIVMVVSAIPIAISCNMMRVTAQGVLARYASPQWAEGAAHGFVGLVMMIPAFFLILLVGWILQNIMIEEVDDKQALRAAKTAGPRPAAARAGVHSASQALPRASTQTAAVLRTQPVRQPPPKATGSAAPAAARQAPAAPITGARAAARRPAAPVAGGPAVPPRPAIAPPPAVRKPVTGPTAPGAAPRAATPPSNQPKAGAAPQGAVPPKPRAVQPPAARPDSKENKP